MSNSVSDGPDGRLQSLRQTFRATGKGRGGQAIAALSSLRRTARGKDAALAGCSYCGSALATVSRNCDNCGAAAPAPARDAAAPSMATRMASLALWYAGGFFGLHCYAAGRPLRGLIYLAGVLSVVFTLMSFDQSGQMGGLGGNGIMLVAIALALLWICDGVQILRGRFA